MESCALASRAPPSAEGCPSCWFRLLCLACAVEQQTPAVGGDLLRHAIELHQAGDITAAIPEYRAYLKQVPGKRHGAVEPGRRAVARRAL